MVGFFSQIRGKFTAQFSGRYLTTLLSELAQRDASSFSRAFGLTTEQARALRKGMLQIEPEWRYLKTSKKERIADLAILDGGVPILLVEVKEDDVNSGRNAMQLDDYLDAVLSSTRGTRFVHLSRYSPNRDDALKLRSARQYRLPVESIRYRDLQASLDTKKNIYSDLLNDYLKDIGVATYKTLDIVDKDKKDVAFFLSQTLGFPHAAGLGKLHSRSAADGAADVLKTRIANLEVLGEWVVDCNQGRFAKRFIRKFRPRPEFDIGRLKKDLQDVDGGIAELPNQEHAFGCYVKSGRLAFFTQGTLGSGSVPWLICELGMSFYIDRAKETRDRPITLEMYAGFYGHHGIWAQDWKSGLKAFPSEQKAMATYSKLLQTALAEAQNSEGAARHRALTSFKVPE